MRFVALFAVGVLVVGCAKPSAEKFVDQMDAMTAVLARVKDKESAQAAVPDLQELNKKSKQLRLRKDLITDEQQKKIDEVMERFNKEVKRILRNPELGKIIAPALPGRD